MTSQSEGKPVFCLNCNNLDFRVNVTKNKVVLQCQKCPWSMSFDG